MRVRVWAGGVGAEGPPQASDDLSDPFPLGLELRGWSQATLARHFGNRSGQPA